MNEVLSLKMLKVFLVAFVLVKTCQTIERPLVIGHRGSGYLPELTLETQSMGHALRSNMIEIDVCLSRDNQLVVVHGKSMAFSTIINSCDFECRSLLECS